MGVLTNQLMVLTQILLSRFVVALVFADSSLRDLLQTHWIWTWILVNTLAEHILVVLSLVAPRFKFSQLMKNLTGTDLPNDDLILNRLVSNWPNWPLDRTEILYYCYWFGNCLYRPLECNETGLQTSGMYLNFGELPSQTSGTWWNFGELPALVELTCTKTWRTASTDLWNVAKMSFVDDWNFQYRQLTVGLSYHCNWRRV